MVLLSVTSVDAQKAPSAAKVKKAIQTACDLLVHNQENYQPDPPVGKIPEAEFEKWTKDEKARLAKIRKESGDEAKEWPYEGVYRVRPDGRIPPGYRVGGSAIVCQALIEAPGLDDDRHAAVVRSVKFMLDLIHKDAGMAGKAQTNYDVRGWGQAYALKLFVRMLEIEFIKDAELAKRVKDTIPHLIDCLAKGKLASGGWNYAGPRAFSPFMTGSTLIALLNAKTAGYAVDDQMIESALDALETGRGDNSSYAYSGKPRRGEVAFGGSTARSAVAELCLYRAGRSDVERLRQTVDQFFQEENWKELLVRKSQQGTHVGKFGVAPYYFFYGHTYAAMAAEHLPEAERKKYRKGMRSLLWRTIESHGGWNDRVFPRTESYSTAMSVLALIAEDLPKVPAFGSAAKEKDL